MPLREALTARVWTSFSSRSSSHRLKSSRQKEAFDRDYLVLHADFIDGRGIIRRLLDATGFHAIGSGSTVELLPAVENAYASVLDFFARLYGYIGRGKSVRNAGLWRQD